MLRFKHFTGTGQNLEQQVNSWLEQFEPDVKEMVQTLSSNGAITISFLFEEGFRGSELRFAAEHRITRATEPVISLDTIPDDPIHLEEDPARVAEQTGGRS